MTELWTDDGGAVSPVFPFMRPPALHIFRPSSFNLYNGAMRRNEVIARLKAAETQLKARGVTHAALFGSLARGEERHDSDIDILIEIDHDRCVGVYAYVGVVKSIEEMFPDRVDVANRSSLKSYVRPGVERDAVYAF